MLDWDYFTGGDSSVTRALNIPEVVKRQCGSKELLSIFSNCRKWGFTPKMYRKQQVPGLCVTYDIYWIKNHFIFVSGHISPFFFSFKVYHFIYLSNLHTQHGAWTYDPKIKSPLLYWTERARCLSHISLKRKKSHGGKMLLLKNVYLTIWYINIDELHLYSIANSYVILD